jgi:hypothetical protein
MIMGGTMLFLAFLALLYKLNTDTDARWWYSFAGGITLMSCLGWRPSTLSLLIAWAVFKVFKDVCQAGN